MDYNYTKNSINSMAVDFFDETPKLLAEKELRDTVYNNLLTKSGAVSRNPNLDGFFQEELHAASFNQNAIGSGWHAEVLKPSGTGHGYGKNSVDIVLKYKGKIARRYQCKYGKTAKDTIKMIKEGNYTTQRLLVPKEQVAEVQKAFPNKTVTALLETPDGRIISSPTTKEEGKIGQRQMQNGTYNLNTGLDLVKGVTAQALKAGAITAAISVTSETLLRFKDFKDGKITGEEYLTEVLKSGGEAGLTAAGTSAVMVPIQASAAALGIANPVLIPVTFVVGAAVNKIIAPLFGRGEYRKILGEAKYYHDLIDYEARISDVMRESAKSLQLFEMEIRNQKENFQTIMNAINYYEIGTKNSLDELDKFIKTI